MFRTPAGLNRPWRANFIMIVTYARMCGVSNIGDAKGLMQCGKTRMFLLTVAHKVKDA